VKFWYDGEGECQTHDSKELVGAIDYLRSIHMPLGISFLHIRFEAILQSKQIEWWMNNGDCFRRRVALELKKTAWWRCLETIGGKTISSSLRRKKCSFWRKKWQKKKLTEYRGESVQLDDTFLSHWGITHAANKSRRLSIYLRFFSAFSYVLFALCFMLRFWKRSFFRPSTQIK